MKGRVIPAALVAFVLLAASAVGASRYLINSTRQIQAERPTFAGCRQGPREKPDRQDRQGHRDRAPLLASLWSTDR